MPALHVYSEARFLGLFTLSGGTTWIGRGLENQVILPGMSVARRHALLYKEGRQFVLEDKSAKGIEVNDRTIPQGVLQHEDFIRIGTYRLVFDALCEGMSRAEVAPVAVASSEPGAPRWYLVVLSGENSGAAIALKVGVTKIGRSEKNDLVLGDVSVSAFHAEVERTDDAIILRDRGSTNGTWIHGERQDEITLYVDTEVHVGQTRLVLRSHAISDPSTHTVDGGVATESLPDRIREAAASPSPLLICGESGVGKGWAAREVHRFSQNSGGDFVEVDGRDIPSSRWASALLGHEKGATCWALSQHRGAFERAAQGMLFLRRIDSLDPPTQTILLQTLEQQAFKRCGGADAMPASFRLIAATDLATDSDALHHALSPELYGHLSPLSLSPLRERREKILPLTTHFLAGKEIAAAAADKLTAHAWPGNIAELQSVVERAIILAEEAERPTIEADDVVIHPPSR
jgi:pSer/pThr/pTyr-binding forkhead associated (FHA) protein